MKEVRITHYFAHQFRNLNSVRIAPHPLFNLVVGPNGQGKTNLLESISVGLGFKPLRSLLQSSDLIAFGKDEASVRLQLTGTPTHKLGLSLHAAGKKYLLDDKPSKDLKALHRQFALISFVPEDMGIINASSSHRRRALNQIAQGLIPDYLTHYRSFEKALAHRNQLLKQQFFDPAELDAFDQIFIQAASQVLWARWQSFHQWRTYFERCLPQISTSLPLAANYQPEVGHFDGLQGIQEQLAQKLKENRKEERFRKVTLAGPHLDDIDFRLGEHPARYVASRGQARAAVLALKIGLLNAVADQRQLSPILLLDDVLSELDVEKARLLLRTVSELSAQTFITTTEVPSFIPGPSEVIELKQGQITDLQEAAGMQTL